MKRLATAAAVALAACVTNLEAPAPTDELAEAVAAINASVVGRWAGASTGMAADAQTGERITQEAWMSYALADEQGLTLLSWSESALRRETYEGDGVVTVSAWSRQGAKTTYQARIVDIQGPDEAGNWRLVRAPRTSLPSNPDYLRVTAMTDGVHTVEVQAREKGDDGPFTSMSMMTLAKEQ